MFGLFKSTRTKATEAAIAVLRPMIGMLQLGPGIPPRMWHDPYILGFTHGCIGLWAKFMTGGKVRGMDMGLVGIDTYTAISNMNGQAISQVAYDLAIAKNPEFVRGAENAAVFFFLSINDLKDEHKYPLVVEARAMAKLSGEEFGGVLLWEIWNKEVRRIAKSESGGDQS